MHKKCGRHQNYGHNFTEVRMETWELTVTFCPKLSCFPTTVPNFLFLQYHYLGLIELKGLWLLYIKLRC